MPHQIKSIEQYYNPKTMPHLWCTGCGDGIVMMGMMRAFSSLNWDPKEIVMVGGIGCSGRMPFYVKVNGINTTHGRPIAFATGIKFANPKLNVVVITGDGDLAAIGGNHFIHACRRNIDMTIVCINNQTYGMTSGQMSPTTGHGNIGSSAPYGAIEHAFDLCELAKASGASFIARATAYHVEMLPKIFKQAYSHVGLSFVEVLTSCPTYFGKYNKMPTPAQNLSWYKDSTIGINQIPKGESPPPGKIPIGVLYQEDKEEFVREYDRLVELVQSQAG